MIEGRFFEGVASVFGVIDDEGDRIISGAYTKTLRHAPAKIRCLWQHNMSMMPVGVYLCLAEVGRADLPQATQAAYPQATGGLWVAGYVLPTAAGDDLLACLQNGAVREMSINGYLIGDLKPDEADLPAVRRVLREIDLVEVSPVNWGMNTATSLQWVPPEGEPALRQRAIDRRRAQAILYHNLIRSELHELEA